MNELKRHQILGHIEKAMLALEDTNPEASRFLAMLLGDHGSEAQYAAALECLRLLDQETIIH